MISLAECRKILGEAGRDLTDAQLERLRQELYGLADIAVTCFLAKEGRKATVPDKDDRLTTQQPASRHPPSKPGC